MIPDNDWTCTTGVIYRNAMAHVVSRHAYFPSVIISENGEILVSFAIGEAFEAVNLNTFISRSIDNGHTWSDPQLLIADDVPDTSQFARLFYHGHGKVVANISRCSRKEHPNEGLANPDNIGFVPTTLFTIRSDDFGGSWYDLQQVNPPLEGPCFEMCSAISELSTGKWIWPTSTWRDWNGNEPNGMKMVSFVSNDKGKTWPEYWTVMDDHESKIIYWESKIIEIADNELVSVAWTYDEQNGKDLNIHYSFSADGGNTWSKPSDTGLVGQTVYLIKMTGQRVLTVYRRTDEPGLWGAISSIDNRQWKNIRQIPLWGNSNSKLLEKSGNMVQNFNELKFGAPSVVQSGENEFMIVFWCYENLVSNIRWIKLKFS